MKLKVSDERANELEVNYRGVANITATVTLKTLRDLLHDRRELLARIAELEAENERLRS